MVNKMWDLTREEKKPKQGFDLHRNFTDQNVEKKKYTPLVAHGLVTGGSALLGLRLPYTMPVGLALSGAGLITHFINDMIEGKSVGDAFKSLKPLLSEGFISASGALGTKKLLKIVKVVHDVANTEPKTQKFVEDSMRIIESKIKGEEVPIEKIQQLERLSQDKVIQRGLTKFNEKIVQYKDRIPELAQKMSDEFKKPYNKELEALSKIPQEEIGNDALEKFRKNIENRGLTQTTELNPAIENIQEIIQGNNPANIDILRQSFQSDKPNQQPTRFPSVKPENFPLPKQLKTPYEEAIYEAIKPRLQDPKSQEVMDWLYQKKEKPQLMQIFKEIEKASQLDRSKNDQFNDILKFFLK